MKLSKSLIILMVVLMVGACSSYTEEQVAIPLEEDTVVPTTVITDTPDKIDNAASPPPDRLTSTVEPRSTPTITPSATSTTSHTPPPTSTHTATPISTDTATPTSVSWSDTVIISDNADQVMQLKIWGKGIVEEVNSVDQGKKIIIRTPRGVYLYTKDGLNDLEFLDGALSYIVSPDSRFFAVAYQGGIVEVWNASSLTLVKAFEHEAEIPKYPAPDFNINDLLAVRAMAFANDGSLFAVAYGNNQIKLIQMSDGELLQVFESNFTPIPVTLIFSPNGKFLVSDDQRISRGGTRRYINTLAIWSVEDGELISTIPEAGMLGDFPIHPDSSQLAASKPGGFILLYSLPEGKLISNFGSGTGFPTVDYSSDGEYLYINGGYQIRRIDDGKKVTLEDKSKLRQMPINLTLLSDEQEQSTGHFRGTQAIKLTSDDQIVVWGSDQNIVYRWDLVQQSYRSFEFDTSVRWVNNLAISIDESLVALCTNTRSRYETLYMLAVDSNTIEDWGDCRGIISFSPDGKILAVGNRSLIDILDVEDGSLIGNMRGHSGPPNIVVFSTDGQYLMSSNTTGRGGGDLIIWKMDPASKDQILNGITGRINSMRMSSDGSMLVSAGDRLRFWRLSDGWQLSIISIEAESLAFSPDGTVLAVGGHDGAIHLLDVPSGDELALLQGHQDEVVDVVFGPEGKNIISTSSDGTVRLWGIQ